MNKQTICGHFVILGRRKLAEQNVLWWFFDLQIRSYTFEMKTKALLCKKKKMYPCTPLTWVRTVGRRSRTVYALAVAGLGLKLSFVGADLMCSWWCIRKQNLQNVSCLMTNIPHTSSDSALGMIFQVWWLLNKYLLNSSLNKQEKYTMNGLNIYLECWKAAISREMPPHYSIHFSVLSFIEKERFLQVLDLSNPIHTDLVLPLLWCIGWGRYC